MFARNFTQTNMPSTTWKLLVSEKKEKINIPTKRLTIIGLFEGLYMIGSVTFSAVTQVLGVLKKT